MLPSSSPMILERAARNTIESISPITPRMSEALAKFFFRLTEPPKLYTNSRMMFKTGIHIKRSIPMYYPMRRRRYPVSPNMLGADVVHKLSVPGARRLGVGQGAPEQASPPLYRQAARAQSLLRSLRRTLPHREVCYRSFHKTYYFLLSLKCVIPSLHRTRCRIRNTHARGRNRRNKSLAVGAVVACTAAGDVWIGAGGCSGAYCTPTGAACTGGIVCADAVAPVLGLIAAAKFPPAIFAIKGSPRPCREVLAERQEQRTQSARGRGHRPQTSPLCPLPLPRCTAPSIRKTV